MPLTLLHPFGEYDKKAVAVDIIAVHGLNGDHIKTWTNPKTGAFWLKDFLPWDVTGCRVFTFGYNANVVFGNTTADIADHSNDLLSSLVDERDEDIESRRPIIFIAHSLGGIVVKQALIQAQDIANYKSISEATAGIIFLGTPHQGSEKANYGKILAGIATKTMNRPSSRLITALRTNSDSLLRISADFNHLLPKYHVVSFYETKPMMIFSTLIVEKDSALLGIDREEKIPVDANHRDMCRFVARSDHDYRKLFKRILKMLQAKAAEQPQIRGTNIMDSPAYDLGQDELCEELQSLTFYNKYYEIPHNVSSVFTGREDILQRLQQSCLSSGTQAIQRVQRRFVLFGLGGSGKTQTCLKFAQDHRERFWGIFWIDMSSTETAERSFIDIAKVCGLEANVMAVKRWLSNTKDAWLLIMDNADNPEMDVSQYFPPGGRGVILLTTRNPACKIHETVGSYEFGRMEPEEATRLLLNASDASDVSDESSRNLAKSIVEKLGCLALAIIQAGAVIRQKVYSMEEYCNMYARQHTQLLSRKPVQDTADYEYTVYTTWEVSVDMIKKMSTDTAHDAIELLQLFAFFHCDGISEDILMRAWEEMKYMELSTWAQSHQLRVLADNSQEWESCLIKIREAVILLSSFSLISIDGRSQHISMHPLVHLWTRDRLGEDEQDRFWTAALILGMSIPWEMTSLDYAFRRSLLPHIMSCLGSRSVRTFIQDDAELELIEAADAFALVYQDCGRKEALELREKALEARKRIQGDEHPNTLNPMSNLVTSYIDFNQIPKALELAKTLLDARKRISGDEHSSTLSAMSQLGTIYNQLGLIQKAFELNEKVLEARKRILGDEHPDTLISMNNLANRYSDLGQTQKAFELDEKILEIRKKILGNEHPNTLTSMSNLANRYGTLGQTQKAFELDKRILETRKRILGNDHPDTLGSMSNLANRYSDLGQAQKAFELDEKALEAMRRILGDEHPDTLTLMSNLAIRYTDLGQAQKAFELDKKVLEARKRILGDEHPDTLMSMNNLAIRYSDLGQTQKAFELYEKVLEARKRILGDEHPDTLQSMYNLAWDYGELGQRQAALELVEKLLEARKRILGEEHPDTLKSEQLCNYLKGQSGSADPGEPHTSPENSEPRQTKPGSRWSMKSWMKRHL